MTSLEPFARITGQRSPYTIELHVWLFWCLYNQQKVKITDKCSNEKMEKAGVITIISSFHAATHK